MTGFVGGWRLTGYEVTADGKTDHPLGGDPLGAILASCHDRGTICQPPDPR